MPSGGHMHVGLQGPWAPPAPALGVGAHRAHPQGWGWGHTGPTPQPWGGFAWMWICLMRPAEKSSVSRRLAGRK